MNEKIYVTPVAKSTPFDNSSNGFTATDVQTAIEEAKTIAIAGPSGLFVSGISSTSTSSTTYGQLDSLTLTATLTGNWAIFFDCQATATNSNTTTYVSIFINGVQNTISERFIDGNGNFSLKTSQVISVAAGQIVTIQWKVSAHTASVTGRSLIMIKVS